MGDLSLAEIACFNICILKQITYDEEINNNSFYTNDNSS